MLPKRFPALLGWVLLLFGAALLLDRWHPHLLGWSTALIALGVALFYLGAARDRGAIFPGTFLLLLGLLNLLRSQGVADLPWSLTWPLILLILGVAFVTLFIFDPDRRGALPIGIFIIIISFLFIRFPHFWKDILDTAGTWWPVIFILIGLRILWSSRKNKSSRQDAKSQKDPPFTPP
jgi:hypothetical protein